MDKDVHTEHCCIKHGCKYDVPNCTVVTGQKKQSFPCETCEWELERGAPYVRDTWRMVLDHINDGITINGLKDVAVKYIGELDKIIQKGEFHDE